jgi:hypothetical protein
MELASNTPGDGAEDNMTRGAEALLPHLNGEGRNLENIKFFPGFDRALTSDLLADAADKMLRAALENPVDQPPVCGATTGSLEQRLTS